MRIANIQLASCLLLFLICDTVVADGTWQDTTNGAKMWNPNPVPNETIMWTGRVDSDGYATGRGLRIWLVNGTVTSVNSVELVRGKSTEQMMFTIDASGNIGASALKDGQWIAYDLDVRKRESIGGTKWTVTQLKGLAGNKIEFATSIYFNNDGTFSMLETNSGGGIPASSRASSGEYSQSGNVVSAVVTKGLVAPGGKAPNTMRFEMRGGTLLLFDRRGNDTNVEFRAIR